MKKIIKIFLIIVLSFSVVCATDTDIEIEAESERINLNNYGVNKKWDINSSNIENVLRTPVANPQEKIYDYGNILTKEEKEELYTLIGNYIEHTNMEMVILTIDMPYINDYENEDFAVDFYDYNDFGLDLDKYSGVLLLRNKYESDPYFDVYMFGDAQLYYDFDRCDYMLDHIYPYFVSKDYLTGFKYFISDFTEYYDNGIALEDYYVDDMGYLHQIRNYNMPLIPAIVVALIASIITTIVMVRKNKMVKKSVEANDYIDTSSVKFHTKTDVLTGSFTTHYTIQSSSGSSGGGGGGFSSSSGSSGGGHSSGGGRHG